MKIVFIQHASALGGSVVSLLYTVQGLMASGYSCKILIAHQAVEVRDFYLRNGIEAVIYPRFSTVSHTTASHSSCFNIVKYFQFLFSYYDISRKLNLEDLLVHHPCDFFHLNSITLAPVARKFLKSKIPFLWHVREAPVRGLLGCRYNLLRRLLINSDKRVIFISNSYKNNWVSGLTGTVIYNFVNTKTFLAAAADSPTQLVSRIKGKPIILFLGGPLKIKGTRYLMEALCVLREWGISFRCVMPGYYLKRPEVSHLRKSVISCLQWLGIRSYSASCTKIIKDNKLEEVCLFLPFTQEVPELMATATCVVFPAIKPHFPRPVIESQIVGTRCVASDIEGVREVIYSDRFCLLVPPANSIALAKALSEVLSNANVESERESVKKYSANIFSLDKQITLLKALYESLKDNKTVNPLIG